MCSRRWWSVLFGVCKPQWHLLAALPIGVALGFGIVYLGLSLGIVDVNAPL